MSARAWAVPLGVVAIGAAVYAAGVALTDPAGVRGVAVGVMLGCGFQLLFLFLARVVLPGKHLLAYGLGMIGRLMLLGVVMLGVLPATGLPVGPTLYSLVAVLFATTLLEPVALAAGTQKKS